jgi:hypothetical protein
VATNKALREIGTLHDVELLKIVWRAVSQQVLRIETESAASVAFCFHPFKPLLTMVDARGVVRVVNYRPMSGDAKHAVDARSITNRFHVGRGVSCSPLLRA